MKFPADIKSCMKECILSLIWPKKEIIQLFISVGCTSSDMKVIHRYQEEELSRAAIIDRMFQSLDRRDDNGIGQYRALLKSLIDWSTFSTYWFDKERKLDREKAEKNLTHLRQLQEIRDASLKQARERNAAEEAKSKEPSVKLPQVRERFLSLFNDETISSQKRGYVFEEVLRDLSKLSSLETTGPYRVNGEQIDGSVKYDGEHYLIEAKWHDAASSNEALYQFAGKIEGKMYGRGVFISVNGFSRNVVESLIIGKAIKTILVDGGDITLVTEGLLTFAEMLNRKIKAAQTRGLIYVDIDGREKV